MRKIWGAMVLLALLGLGALTVAPERETPAAADVLARHTQELAAEDAQTRKLQQDLALWYNLNLLAREPEPGFREAYGSILCYTDQIMGSLEIPAAGVRLPIYHGVSAAVLKKGVGHAADSAFPIGGEGNHTVLAGQLMEELAALETGDLIYIHILDQVLAYEVEEIRLTEGETPELLEPVPGRDLCSVTAWGSSPDDPQQLLIRAARTEPQPRETAGSSETRSGVHWLLPAGAIGTLLFTALRGISARRRRTRDCCKMQQPQ